MEKETKNGGTAADLAARLRMDKFRSDIASTHQAAVDNLKFELKPEQDALFAELASVGWRVTSLADVLKQSAGHPEAIPVLCKHLKLARNKMMRVFIAHALKTNDARGKGGQVILAEMKRPPEENPEEVRLMLADTLTVVADKSMIADIKTLLADSRYANSHLTLGKVLRSLEAQDKWGQAGMALR